MLIFDRLTVDISLLAPYYTMYVCRTYRYTSFDKTSRGICFLESLDLGIEKLRIQLKKLVEKEFPSYTFFSLFELDKIKIYGGIPFGGRTNAA